tara:strand:- start:5986 stop:7971 length:1986 start_codon:yes stop_codon:yes gene_type:complete
VIKRERNKKQALSSENVFTVPFSLGEIKDNLSISTLSHSKVELINQSIKLHSQGNIKEAERLYHYIINKGYVHHKVYSNYAAIMQEKGKLKEAELLIREAIKVKPDYANAHLNLGTILKRLGNLKGAELSTRNAIKLNPYLAQAHSNLGNTLRDLGKLKEAELSTRKAIQLNPNLADAYSNLGIIMSDIGKIEEAEKSYRKAIEINPNYTQAYYNLGNILRKNGNLKEAELSTRKAIKLSPDLAEAYSNLGNILRDLSKLEEAELSTRKAIQLNPSCSNSHLNLGAILKDLSDLKEAEIYTRKAIDLNPNCAESHLNLGAILKDLGKLEEAELSTRKAIQLNPKLEDAKYNLSLILLKSNNFKEGLIQYESRWKIWSKNNLFYTSNKPKWNPLNRGRVLLWAEQGIGDEILFASLIPELFELVDQLIVKVDERLIPLFKRSFDSRIIYIKNNENFKEELYDFQVAMGSIIKYLRPDKESFKKGKQVYLKVNRKKTNIYRDMLLKDSKFKKIIGISWISKSKTNKYKSISLEKFILGIYSPNICFLNLQYGDTKDEIENIKTKYNIDIFEIKEVDNYNNIDDLAALVNACDMVVSIENIIFALAGGLGIDSKILLRRNCLWFNGDKDVESYWFTNQLFFRQSSSGGWEKAFSKIRNEIEAII